MSLTFMYKINTVHFVGVTELSTLINIAHFGQRLFGIRQSLGEPTAAHRWIPNAMSFAIRNCVLSKILSYMPKAVYNTKFRTEPTKLTFLLQRQVLYC
jgi:hypothetical protein